jgi:hypothetical protein
MHKGAKAMFCKPPINNATKPIAVVDSLQEFVVNLDEHSEESLSGGNHSFIPIFILANLSQQDKPGYRFPCDGPGRGGTCD